MPNLSSILKTEISRISRKEIKVSLKALQSSNATLRKTVTELKKRVASLESQLKKLPTSATSIREQEIAPEAAENVRVSSKSIMTLRKKLGLSQGSFAKLLGVSSQAVYVMEHKGGQLRLRQATLKKYLSIRSLGKKEARKLLDEIDS